MVVLVIFNSFNVVKNLKKPDPVCAKCSHLTLLFGALEISVLKNMRLILLIFFAPGLAWQATLRKTKVKLNLLIDINTYRYVTDGRKRY